MASVVASAASPTASAAGRTADDFDFADELKDGMAVLLHVKVGKLEPASLRLDEETGKLVVKTNREGWRALCHCYSRNYELGPDELEPVPLRTHTRQLSRSISIVNGGDPHLVKMMQQRSLSLLRRFPTSESIDLTFATAETEERLRLWAQQNLAVKPAVKIRQSSAHVMSALAGHAQSESSDQESASSDDPLHPDQQQKQQQQQQQQRGERDLPPALPRSASVHPAQQQTRLERRHSLNPFKRQSQRTSSRRDSTGSDRFPSGGDGGNVERGSSSNSGGGGWASGGTMDRDLDDDGGTENASWAYREPPMLRRMQTARTAGRSRSRSRGSSVTAPPRGETYPTEDTPALGRVASMGTGMDRRERQKPGDLDFWDPLGLMTNITPRTPMTARSVRSGQRSGEWETTPKSTPRGTPSGTPKASPKEPRGRRQVKDSHTE